MEITQGPFYTPNEILAISAVHSLHAPAIRTLVERAGGGMATVGALLATVEPRRLELEGEIFCMRRLSHHA